MHNTKVAYRYAMSLMVAAREANQIEQVFADVLSLKSTWNASKDFRQLCKTPVVSGMKKQKIIAEIFEGRLSPLTVTFLNLLTVKNRDVDLNVIIDQFISQYYLQANILPVEFLTAVPINEKAQQRLIDKMVERTGKTILPTFTVSPEIRGGVVIKVGTTIIDGSLQHQLDRLYATLVNEGFGLDSGEAISNRMN